MINVHQIKFVITSAAKWSISVPTCSAHQTQSAKMVNVSHRPCASMTLIAHRASNATLASVCQMRLSVCWMVIVVRAKFALMASVSLTVIVVWTTTVTLAKSVRRINVLYLASVAETQIVLPVRNASLSLVNVSLLFSVPQTVTVRLDSSVSVIDAWI